MLSCWGRVQPALCVPCGRANVVAVATGPSSRPEGRAVATRGPHLLSGREAECALSCCSAKRRIRMSRSVAFLLGSLHRRAGDSLNVPGALVKVWSALLSK
ncbi:MAG: hypothetical protein JWN04_823 [Myxococcaceae bacterium]|nr:hypothetical protein [Myxococcaceae bacterium]